MGCASSKQTRCKHCQCQSSPLPRSYSLPVHHPAQRKGDTNHVVALTSTTLGSLKLSSVEENYPDDHQTVTTTTTTNNYNLVNENGDRDANRIKEFSMQVTQAMSWSNMINEKIPKVIPKTPTRTPPGEPETINTWELMEGLDDASPLRLPHHNRSFSFHTVLNSTHLDQPEFKLQGNGIVSPILDQPNSKLRESCTELPFVNQPQSQVQENGVESPCCDQPESKEQENGIEPLSLDQTQSKVQEHGIKSPAIDQPNSKLQENCNGLPNKAALQENGIGSPAFDQSKLKLQDNCNGPSKPEWLLLAENDSNVKSDSIVSDFDPEIISTFRKALEEISPVKTVYLRSPDNEKATFPADDHLLSKEFIEANKLSNVNPSKCPPHGEDKVVIYFTSLRGVRKTYEDCCHVRVILKGFGVRVDERDVSMHYGFREELKETLGSGFSAGLPKVFVKGQYIGGAEEIRQLNEDGELEKVVEGCAVLEDGNGGGICESCGDVRFVPCENCSGSCKIYCEDEDEWEGEDGGGGFQRCPDCNENGLVRCPVCCD